MRDRERGPKGGVPVSGFSSCVGGRGGQLEVEFGTRGVGASEE